MLTEASAKTRDLFPIMDVTTAGTGGGTLRLAPVSRPTCAPSLGTAADPAFYDGRVITWGTLPRVAHRDMSLSPVVGQITVDDSDRRLAATMMRIVGQSVTIRLVGPNIKPADYLTVFKGVMDAPEKHGSQWILKIRTADDWLKQEFPKRLISLTDFPNCHADALNKPVPIVYGTHDASGYTAVTTGAMRTYFVNTVAAWFLWCGHIHKSVARVFINGRLGVNGTDYSVSNFIVNGQQYTRVVLNSAATINTSSVANPTVITTALAHGLVTGDVVWIGGHVGSTPAIDGQYQVTVTGAATFTIPIQVTVGGTGGSVFKVNGPSGGTVGSIPAITIDGTGIEVTGDGTGATINDSNAQFRHMLINWVYNTWTRPITYDTAATKWWDTDAISNAIDVTITQAAIDATLAMHLLGGCRYIGEQTRTAEVELQQFCKDWAQTPFWTMAGRLAWSLFDYRTQNAALYTPGFYYREADDVINGQISQEFDATARTRLVASKWAAALGPGSEKFYEQGSVSDPTSVSRLALQRDSRWFRLSLAGNTVAPAATAARIINRGRAPLPLLKARMQLRILDQELMTPAQWTWDNGQSADGTVGWGDEVWKRTRFVLLETTLDLDALEVDTVWEQLEDAETSGWFMGYFDEPGKTVSNQVDGILELAVGVSTATRAGVKYVEDVSNRSVVPLAANIAPIDRQGTLVEQSRSGRLLHSTFDTGLAAWTVVTGTATVATDTTDRYFTDATTVIKFTGTGAAGDSTIKQADAVGAAGINNKASVMVDYKDDAGTNGNQDCINVWVRRSSDSFYWVGGAWQAGRAPAAVGPHSQGVWKTVEVRNIAVGGVAATLTVEVGVATTLFSSGSISRVAYVQLDVGSTQSWPSSRTNNLGVVLVRAADTLSTTQADAAGTAKQTWPQEQGTIEAEVATEWSQAELATGNQHYLLHLQFAAGTNEWQLYFDSTDGKWHFKVISGGVSYDCAVTPPTGAPGNTYRSFGWIIARWTGAQNELGVAAKTLMLSVSNGDGTSSGLVTTILSPYVTPVTTASKSIFRGSSAASTLFLDGWYRKLRFMPDVKPDSYVLARHRGALLF